MPLSNAFTGISQLSGRQRWRAHLRLGGKQQHLGYFDSAEAAAASVDAAREDAGLPPVNFLPSGEPLVPQSGHEGITWVGAGQWRVDDTGALYPTVSVARAAQRRTRPRRALKGTAPRRSITPRHCAALTTVIKGYNAWADAKRAELAVLEPWRSMPPSTWRVAMRKDLKEQWALERPRVGGAGGAGEAAKEGAGPVARVRGSAADYWEWAKGRAAEMARNLPFRDMDRVKRQASIKVKIRELWALKKMRRTRE